MNEQKPERVTSHAAQGLWEALSAAGKKDLAKKARAIFFQMFTYETALRRLRAEIEKGNFDTLLPMIDVTLNGKNAEVSRD